MNEPKRLVSVFAALVVVLVAAQPTLATQYDPPWADAMWAHFPGENGLYTKGTMDYVKSNLTPQYDAFSTNPDSAHQAMGQYYAKSDAIWWMAGHAAAGLIQTYNSTNGYTTIYSGPNVPGADCASPNACLADYAWSDMHDINLMVFMGCHSGSQPPTGARLPKKAHDYLGVDASIGWDETIYFSRDTSDWWVNDFTWNAWHSQLHVLDAAWGATNAVIAHTGQAWGYDSLITYGAGSTKIYPAQYGS